MAAACASSAVQVAAFAMGRGPLAMEQCGWAQNLLQFGVVLALPVIPKDGRFKRRSRGTWCLILRLVQSGPAPLQLSHCH